MLESRVFSFSWLGEISAELAEGMMLAELIAIHEGESRHLGTPREPRIRITREEIIRSARTLRGALIDIDHALSDPKVQLRAEYYREKYGLGTLGPVGQVLDAEAEDNPEVGGLAVEAVASIWDKTVYKLIQDGVFKGCSVVQKYRFDKCVQGTSYVCDAVGVSYPMVSLVLEGEPAFPKTTVRPLRIDRIKQGRLQEIKVPTRIAGISIHYSYSPCSGFSRRLLETSQVTVRPTGMIEASPIFKENKPCDHSGFIDSLKKFDLQTPHMIPTQIYLDLMRSALAETSDCGHRELVMAWMPPTTMAYMPAWRLLSFVSWLRKSLGSPQTALQLHGGWRGGDAENWINPQNKD